jgi:uncharacterized protein (TIGR03086 family)
MVWKDLGMADELLAAVDRSFDYAEEVLRGISDEQRDRPTPCPDFTVVKLAGHLIGATKLYTGLAGGEAADPAGPDLAGQRLDAVFADAAAAARAAWKPSMMGATFQTPFGEMKGAAIATFIVVEVLGHAWDLAAATGHATRPSDDLAETALRLAHLMGDSTLRGPRMMGPAVTVSDDAPTFDRFVAYLGRDPGFVATV